MSEADSLEMQHGTVVHAKKMLKERKEKFATLGLLRCGQCFNVPTTLSVMQLLCSFKSWRSPATWLWVGILSVIALSGLCKFYAPLPLWFYCLQFVFWRLAYNVGIGYVLYYQSHENYLVSVYRSYIKPHEKRRQLLEMATVFEDEETYKIENYPDEFNAWMMFRQVENVILANDLMSYIVLAIMCWQTSSNKVSLMENVCRYLFGGTSIAFSIWSKSDAHRVIGDFAWYWGDFFFLLDKHLDFNGIFQMFPHPMYTVGYSFLYGVPVMTRSYTLFYMSVFAHLAQLAFLAFVENPHIDRTYNKPRSPRVESHRQATSETISSNRNNSNSSKDINSNIANSGTSPFTYFDDAEMMVWRNVNPFRSTDLLLLILISYVVCSLFCNIPTWVYIIHYICWRLFHNGALGCLLRWESTTRWYSSNYSSRHIAFVNWKRIYNASVTMTGVAYCACAFKLFSWNMSSSSSSSEWLPTCLSVSYNSSNEFRVFTMVVGAMLIALNAYVSWSIYYTIGEFGFFYGDFFIDTVPSKLNYSGIYRYLNNPDTSLGMSAYYGVALLSGSTTMFVLAVMSHICSKVFELCVERPHMIKHYGAHIRRMGGLQSELTRRVLYTKEKSLKHFKRWKTRLQRENTISDRTLRRLSSTYMNTEKDVERRRALAMTEKNKRE